ncbi:MAG: sigma-54-dependent Fis family transcriptional regulator [Polyangiaceae bacterium]
MSRLSLLVDLSSALARRVDLDGLLETACERIAQALRAERATIWLVDAERRELVARLALALEPDELRQPIGRGIAGRVAESGVVLRVDDALGDGRFDPSADRATGYVTRNILAVPIRERDGAPVRGVLQVLNREQGPFDADDERFLEALGAQLALALSMTTLRAADASGPGLTLRGPFNGVVGRSPPMTEVYKRISLAAQTDASMLLQGETGTGKGLLARAVHDNSARQAAPFVTLDCTTLAAQLVDSELFGHERGAFTGAERRVLGRVELAHGGTLFLDEVGELPLEAQGKLLRFLQERRFERVGGRETLEVDVRLIAATHRDLAQSVRDGRYRQDLYYRLKVVEIEVPPLRERGPAEIRILAQHFAELYARRYNRPSPRFDVDVEAALAAHAWPGNVRELEHFVESAIALSADGHVRGELVPASWRAARLPERAANGVVLPLGLSLEEASRRYVEASIEHAGGNKTEAARMLSIGRNRVVRLLKR